MSKNLKSYLFVLLLAVVVISSWTVTAAQVPFDNAYASLMEDRVTKLEHVSNAYSQLLTQLQQQITNDQREIDLLRGQIQENNYQLLQLVKQQKQLSQQIHNFYNRILTTSDKNQSLLHFSSDGGDHYSSVSSTNVAPSADDANIEYNKIMALILQKKQYDKAISALKNFIKCYPDSFYQPNVNYWLGQLFYNKDKKDDAAYYFALVVKQYPKSPKAPDALFKIGIIMQKRGYKDKALAIYKQIEKLYPDTEATKQAQKQLFEL